MNCRKCGCEILETDTWCPMCNAKQGKKTKKKKDDSVSGYESHTAGFNHGKKILIVIGIALIVVIISLNMGDTDERSSSRVHNAPEIPLLFWDVGPQEGALINQMNRNAVLELRLFVGDSAIYMMMEGSGSIIRTTDYFETYEHLITPSPIMFSFNMVNNNIYYRTQMASDRSVFALHHYDLQTGQSTEIFSGVEAEVIINHLVFHQSGFQENLYVFNMETGEREVLVDQAVRSFIVDYPAGQLFFTDDEHALYQANLDGTNQIRIHDWVSSFAVNGDVIALSTLDGILYTYDLTTMIRDRHPISNAESRLRDLMFVGQYLLGRDQHDTLHLLDLKDSEGHWTIIHNISAFGSIGNYIIYTQWNSDEIRRMDLLGQSEFVRQRWGD